MRKLFLMLFLIIITSSLIRSQVYVPLDPGNRYQYYEEYESYSLIYIYTYSSYTKSFPQVRQDDQITVNGRTYLKFEDYYCRYDTASQKLLAWIQGTDSTLIDFSLPVGSMFTSALGQFNVAGITNENVFGESRKCFKITEKGSTSYPDYGQSSFEYSYTFADGIGLIQYYYYSYELIPRDQTDRTSRVNRFLKSALVDSNIYNPLTLSFSLRKPVNDISVNDFPLVVDGYVHATYPQLIDKPFAEIYHYRDTALISYGKYDMINSLPESIRLLFAYNPDTSKIKAGDILKIRVTVSDKSIFANLSTYPDTGFITVRVLPGVTAVNEKKTIAHSYNLSQNYPNPFNPATAIEYSIAKDEKVSLKVFDIMGREAAVLEDGFKKAGTYKAVFNAEGLPSGTYFCRLTAGGFSSTRKMLLIK